jgi:hypothetical protein
MGQAGLVLWFTSRQDVVDQPTMEDAIDRSDRSGMEVFDESRVECII